MCLPRKEGGGREGTETIEGGKWFEIENRINFEA